MDESWFLLYRADGRQRVWHRVGERFADVNVVVEWSKVAVGLWYGQAYAMDSGMTGFQRAEKSLLHLSLSPCTGYQLQLASSSRH